MKGRGRGIVTVIRRDSGLRSLLAVAGALESLAGIRDGLGVAAADRVELVVRGLAGDGLACPALLLRDLANEPVVALGRGLRTGDAGRQGRQEEKRDVPSHSGLRAID